MTKHGAKHEISVNGNFVSRSQRRKQSKRLIPDFSFNDLLKNKRVLVGSGSVIGISLLVGSFALGYATAPNPPLDAFTGEVSNSIHYEEQQFPEGWSDIQSETNKNQSNEMNPAPAFNEKCSYKRITTFIAKENQGRGDDFLSKNLVYEYALSQGESNPEISLGKVYLDGESVGSVKGDWDNRSVMVRVFDGEQIIKVPKGFKEALPSGVSTVTDEGIPAVILDYSCGEGFSEEERNILMSGTRISSHSVDK